MSITTLPDSIAIDKLGAALSAVAPQADPAVWGPALEPALLKAECTTVARLAALLGQCRAEAGPAFTALQENLNYSAQGLLATWPTRFTPETAARFARQPELIANTVYANRLGNGDAASGDGWRFRGHGLIQITGRSNFAAFAAWSDRTIEEAVAWALQPEGAAMTAAWFWQNNKLNLSADAADIDAITMAVNGRKASEATKAERLAFSNVARGVLTSAFA